MHYVYILKSNESGKYYIGETDNIERRLKQHQTGRSSFGKRNNGLEIVFKKETLNRSEAKKLELFIKKQKSHTFIDKLIQGKITIPL